MMRLTRPIVVTLVALLVLAGCTSREPDPTPPEEAIDPDLGPDPDAAPTDDQRWVSPDGDDDLPGSEEAPWRTLSHAFERLEAGHTLHVADGEYRERVTNLALASGTSDEPIRVVAAPGAAPVVRGLLWLTDADHWHIQGVHVTWDADGNAPYEHMVKFEGGRGWRYSGAEVWGARSFAGILVSENPDDWVLRDLCVRHTEPTNGPNQDHLIYVNNGLGDGSGVVEDNVLFGAPNGSGIKLGGPSPDRGGASDVTVRNNTIVDAVQPILVAWNAQANLLENNVLGRAGEGYGAIRGYELWGYDNVARDNVGFDAATFVLNDEGYLGVQEGGGNRFLTDATFDEPASCTGLEVPDRLAADAGQTTSRS